MSLMGFRSSLLCGWRISINMGTVSVGGSLNE